MKRLVPIIFFALLLVACQAPQAPTGPELDYIREDFQHLPQEIKEWTENTKDMYLAHSKAYDNRCYILASLGQRPTEGYGITIEDVAIGEESIKVTISTSQPQPGQSVATVITYPRDIVSVANVDLPVEYVAQGEYDFIPTLVGIQELPKIQSQSREIKVFSPAPHSSVSQHFSVEGAANVFEGAFSYLLRDGNGTPTQEQNAIAGMADWYYFQLELEVPSNISQEFTLELFSYSARDSSIINLVEIPLKKGQ